MMATSQVSAVDRENSAAHLGTHEKHHLLGPQKKRGEHQARGTPVLKHFEGSSTNLQKSHRSFGEISNTLDRGSEGSRSEVYKKVPYQPSLLSPSSEEPELVKSLPRRREDHSDIFPPSLLMSHDQLTNFTYFWKSCQKPDLHSSQISSSPSRDLTTIPIMQDAEVILEPVPEDLFHLPPPWE